MRVYPIVSGADDELARAGEATRSALLITAERLFGTYGIDAVSLLAIVRESGQGNKNAVQYHFGSKDGLIRAIVRSRSVKIEQRRAELVVEAGAAGRLDDLSVLVEAMYLPVIEQVNGAGRFTFARFLLQYLNHPGFPDQMAAPSDIVANQPVTGQLRTLLSRALPHLSLEMVEWRVMMQLRLLLTCLVEHENYEQRGIAPMNREDTIRDSLAMVAAGMGAPA
jgi:AcrR family transcriptional regulator